MQHRLPAVGPVDLTGIIQLRIHGRKRCVISFWSIVVGFPAPIILAMIINQLRNKKWKKTVQTTVLICRRSLVLTTHIHFSLLSADRFLQKGGEIP